jgi:disulfide oxidoreductase YuzD
LPEVQIPSVELVDIACLKADGQNPNKMSEKQHKALRESILRYGFIVPIITNKDLLIADGEQRWQEAIALGMKQVQVIKLPVEDVDRQLLRRARNDKHFYIRRLFNYLLFHSKNDYRPIESCVNAQVIRTWNLITSLFMS